MDEIITFPPGVLGDSPVKLAVLGRGAGWFAVEKPAGIVLAHDAFHEADSGPSLVDAINAAAAASKPQLAALGIRGCARIHPVDAEIGGVAVLASDEAVAGTMRNAMGSHRWEFVHELVSEAVDLPDEVRCDLPLARHGQKPRMIVSHRSGKRCSTTFSLVCRLGTHAVWEARSAECRAHQVRAHAAECGLRIVGESLYVRVRPVYLSSLKRGYRSGSETERPLHPGVALRLRLVRFDDGTGGDLTMEAQPSRTFATLIKRLRAGR